jgi:hypothetical protein
MPTISGRASAADDINTLAPMVAASATAILIDINFSRPLAPSGVLKYLRKPPREIPKDDAGLPSHPRIFNRVS